MHLIIPSEYKRICVNRAIQSSRNYLKSIQYSYFSSSIETKVFNFFNCENYWSIFLMGRKIQQLFYPFFFQSITSKIYPKCSLWWRRRWSGGWRHLFARLGCHGNYGTSPWSWQWWQHLWLYWWRPRWRWRSY